MTTREAINGARQVRGAHEAGVQAIEPGMVLQIDPDHGKEGIGNRAFAACLLTVTEVKNWGVMGYVQALGTRLQTGGQAYYRIEWGHLAYVGRSFWWVHQEGEG